MTGEIKPRKYRMPLQKDRTKNSDATQFSRSNMSGLVECKTCASMNTKIEPLKNLVKCYDCGVEEPLE